MEYEFNNKEGNKVKVYLPEEEIDKDTLQQIHSLANNPVLDHIRFMPDTHKGTGCCVGLTSLVNEGIIPNLVGGDIGCGIVCYPLGDKIKEKKYEKIDKMIKQLIPMGKGKINHENRTQMEDWENLFIESNKDLDRLKQKYPDIEINYDLEWYNNFSKKIGSDQNYDLMALGSLGSGNHYIELNVDDSELAYITVHTGSRNLGQKVCAFHQKLTQDQSKVNVKEFHKLADKIPKKIKGEDRIQKEKEIWNELESNLTVPWLEKERMYDYLVDMIFTQNYASLNRKVIVRTICQGLGYEYDEEQIIETIHNYIDFKNMILRKGAISANVGELSIISLNMKEGILLVRGKGNEDWNYSSAHGCGRILNRSQSSKLNMKEFKKEMANVYSTSVVKETLDESPMAYRDVNLIKKCLEGNVEIITQLKPIINCKGI